MDRELIDRFLAARRVAVAGVSRNGKDFSRMLFREFTNRGYEAIPVNPDAESMEGVRCYARVQEIAPPVDAVLLMTPPRLTDIVVRDCAEAGVPLVWMYRAAGAGAVSEAAVEFCRRHDIGCIAGYCPYMFLPKSGFPHSWHGFFARLTGSWPSAA